MKEVLYKDDKIRPNELEIQKITVKTYIGLELRFY